MIPNAAIGKQQHDWYYYNSYLHFSYRHILANIICKEYESQYRILRTYFSYIKILNNMLSNYHNSTIFFNYCSTVTPKFLRIIHLLFLLPMVYSWIVREIFSWFGESVVFPPDWISWPGKWNYMNLLHISFLINFIICTILLCKRLMSPKYLIVFVF